MKRIVLTIVATILAIVIGGLGFIYSGAYNLAATSHHWPVAHWAIETARVRSVKAHAAGILIPPDLDTQVRVVTGVSHYAEECAPCHAAPGVAPEDIAEGMYPKPPALTAPKWTPAELFWIVKNGIKMSGMPSWRNHSDEDLWAIVAFLENLPAMTPERYRELVKYSKAAGGHHMHGNQPTNMKMDTNSKTGD
jgi:mono/diheme cytochrome c family protein